MSTPLTPRGARASRSAALLAAFAVFGPWLTPQHARRAVCRYGLRAADAAAHHRRVGTRPPAVRLSAAAREPARAPLCRGSQPADAAAALPRRRAAVGRSAHGSPWFPLGTDALGGDQLARLAWGTRLSLGVALVAALGALAIGAIVGGIAGFAGGLVDDGLMRVADFDHRAAALYVVLALRAAMPLVLTTSEVFWTMVVVLAVVGWPFPARGVRAVVAAERTREYAEAARALGASRTRLLLRHLLPAARGFWSSRRRCSLPAFVLAEATLSFVGLGFSEPIPSWGAMLREAGRRAGTRRCAVAPGSGGGDRALGARREPRRKRPNPHTRAGARSGRQRLSH